MEEHCLQIVQNQELVLELPGEEIVSFHLICRLCANQNEKIIGIYSEEGISNDLATKMNTYLPVKVSENDILPLQCCWGCASTVLAWHELVLASVEADRRLRTFQLIPEKQLEVEPVFEPQTVLPSLQNLEEKVEISVFDSATMQEIGKSKVKRRRQPVRQKKRIKKKLESADTFSNIIDDVTDAFISESINSDHADEDYGPDTSFENVCIKNEEVNIKNESVNTDAGLYEEKALAEWIRKDKIEKNEEFNFACEYCPTVFTLEEDIINHVKGQHPDKAEVLNNFDDAVQQNEEKKEKRKNTRIDQEAVNAAKVIVEGRVYYNCKTCGKSLHSPYTYIWHMRIHTGERPFVCDLCGKQFRVSQGLVRHLRETHQGIKNFPCDLCGRMFATRRNVVEHRRIHTNERPYICDLCGKTFKQKASLFVHNRSHTDYFPFRCSYCERGFRTKPPLMIHMTRHTGEKPYACDVCGRCFRIKYELKRHRLIHSDEKPFTCTDCGLSFRQKRYLRNHNKVNHNRVTT